jgi:hypothetical protein
MDDRQVELTPFSDGPRPPLGGFLISNRWPETVAEWSQVLAMIVRLAAVPGMINRATVYASRDDSPELPGLAHPVGMLISRGPVIGKDSPGPGTLGHPQPEAVLLLHPPSENDEQMAAGCLLLPGLPHLGLDHRAAWVESDAQGTLRRLVSHCDVDPYQDPDTAVLATLLTA